MVQAEIILFQPPKDRFKKSIVVSNLPQNVTSQVIKVSFIHSLFLSSFLTF